MTVTERDLQHLCRFLHAESAEETHFDHLHFAWIQPRERVHCVIQRHQVRSPAAVHDGCLFQRDLLQLTSALQVMAARMLDQNAPHQLRRNGEEVRAILPLHAPVLHQPHVRLINQRRRLQAVAGAFACHVAPCQTVQFGINNRRQPFQRAGVSAAPGTQQLADVTRSRLIRLVRPLHRLWAEL